MRANVRSSSSVGGPLADRPPPHATAPGPLVVASRNCADLRQATQLAFEIVRDNRDAVIKLADKIDADGHWIPPAD
jgi:hypothetical protein